MIPAGGITDDQKVFKDGFNTSTLVVAKFREVVAKFRDVVAKFEVRNKFEHVVAECRDVVAKFVEGRVC